MNMHALIKMARTLKFNKNFTNYNDILSENYKLLLLLQHNYHQTTFFSLLATKLNKAKK